jgi:glycosyltransferase involved in cell wall biosynthesis
MHLASRTRERGGRRRDHPAGARRHGRLMQPSGVGQDVQVDSRDPPLRVLTVARWYPSHDAPGRGSFVADLVGATVRAGVEARVVSFDRVLTRGKPGPAEAAFQAARAAYELRATPAALFVAPPSRGAPGVPVARLPVIRRPGPDDVGALIDDYLAALRPFVNRLVDDWRPDLIHAHTGLPDGVVAAEIGRDLAIPVVVTEHASTIETDLAHPAALERYRRLLEPGVRLVAVSPSVAERVARLLGVPAERIEVLPNPVFESSFPLADATGRDPNELLWVGSLGEHKGIEVLLRAVAQVLAARPGLHLRLVGSERTSGDRARWQGLAAELGIDGAVSLDGWLERGAVAAAMARAGLFVHPSPSETFGVVAAEAILTGLPVATRRSGGVPWIVELSGGYGRIADGDDASAFALAIEGALGERLPVGAAAARASLVDAVGEAAVARRALDLYGRAIADAPDGAPGEDLRPASLAPDRRPPGKLPRVLVATGRNHALAQVAALPQEVRDRVVLVIPPLQVFAQDPGAATVAAGPSPDGTRSAPPAAPAAPTATVRVRIREAAQVPLRTPKPRGRSPLARYRRRRWRPQATPEEQLAAAVLGATRRDRWFGRTAAVVAIDAPAAMLVAGLGDERVELAPGALRWLADRWDARRTRR